MQAAEERGLPAMESFAAHRGENAPSLWVGAIDSHPNARGHEILFEVLADGLSRLPASCWEARRRSSSSS